MVSIDRVGTFVNGWSRGGRFGKFGTFINRASRAGYVLAGLVYLLTGDVRGPGRYWQD